MSAEKIRREVIRHSRQTRYRPRSDTCPLSSDFTFPSSPTSATPSRLSSTVAIRSPPIDIVPALLHSLPFYGFESYLCASAFPDLLLRPINADGRDGNTTTSTEPYSLISPPNARSPVIARSSRNAEAWGLTDDPIEPLKAAIPSEIMASRASQTSIMSPETRLYSSPLHRQILFSIANNFAGLGAFPFEDVIEYIRNGTSQMLYQMINLASGYYTTQAIAHNLFKAAIEIGDAQTVEFILNHSNIRVNLNSFICPVKGAMYTPLQRASGLQHRDVVRVLLQHRPDINLRYTNQHFDDGALDFLFDTHALHRKPHEHAMLDSEIFTMLVEAGDDLSQESLKQLIRGRQEGELVYQLISKHASSNHEKWSRWGIFQYIVKYLDLEILLKIFEILQEAGVNLNVGHEVGNCPTRIIDVAAQRGNLDLIKLFLSSGATLTDYTLLYSIVSGNEDLVRFLLEAGANCNSIGSLGRPGINTSASLSGQRHEGDDTFLALVAQEALKHLRDPLHISSALRAASEVGTAHVLEFLLQLGGEASPAVLGYALVIATRDGQDEAAQKLIDAGADTNFHSSDGYGDGPPLREALRRRNAPLVRSLLDADAYPSYQTPDWRKPVMMLAIEWGDRSIIQDLINVGGRLNECPALTIAVKKKDRDLVSFLLRAGANINYPGAGLDAVTPLAAAAKNGDTEMASFLLEQGADPYDEEAVDEAAQHNAEIFDLMLDKHKSRYPQGHKGFGSKVLIRAVKSGNTAIFKKMLEKGLEVTGSHMTKSDVPGWYGRINVFGYAIANAKGGDLRILEMVLEAGCSPEDVVCEGLRESFNSTRMPNVTAFLAVISTGNLSSVKLFIRHGADVNFPPRMGVKRTPLQRAAEKGCTEIVQLLINSGANVNAPAARRGGGTALQLAAIGGYMSIAGLLLSYHADVDAPASKVDGYTALEGAAKHGRIDTVALLLNAGAGCYGKDRAQFERAISFAKDAGHGYIGDLLTKYLANGTISSGSEPFDDLVNWDLEDLNGL